jgi:hypothetical protein
MENGFVYLIKASGLIGLFYFAYFLLLRKETFFSGNRWFLLLGLITSSILPLFFITKIIWVEPTTNSFDWSNIPVTTSVLAPEPQIDWYLILAYVYFIGITISLLKLVFDFNSLIQLLKGKTIQQQGNFKFIDLAENIAPFSYFNYIVYNSSLYTAVELENILEHEKVHSLQKHSFDVLISRLFCVFFWFNPLIWLYKKAIAQNLEFIADSEAAKKITDKKAYQLTLLKITTQENCVALTNHFYESLIKKRIIMLNQNQSKKWNSWKYITVFPALVAFVFLFQIEVVAQEKETPKQENRTKSEHTKAVLHDIEKTLDTITKEKNTITTNEEKAGTPNNTIAQLDDKTNVRSVLKQDLDSKPLIIVDGKKQASNFKIEDIPTEQIAKIDVLKGINATGKYGESGKNGAIEITTKEKTTLKNFKPIQRKISKGFQILKQVENEKINENPNKKIIKSYLKEYYIDGKKTTAYEYSKLNISSIEKVETDPFEKKVMIITKTSDTPKSINISEQNSDNNKIAKVNAENKNSTPVDFIKTFRKALVIIDGKESNLKRLLKIKNRNINITNANIFEESTDETKKITLATYGEKARNGVLVVETSPLEKEK